MSLQSPAAMRPRVRSRLERLSRLAFNYDASRLDLEHPPAGWRVDDRREALRPEPPGEPIAGGSFEIASRLIRGYEFADPSIVRAHYDPGAELLGRDMLLELRPLGLFGFLVGTRVVEVLDQEREVGGRRQRVFGWSYRTLAGHVERGQMQWAVEKWLDSGEVDFHVYAVSATAPISNPFVWLGFRLLRDRERTLFIDSTQRRMRELTALALESEGDQARLRQASLELTARPSGADDVSHDQLARALEEPGDPA